MDGGVVSLLALALGLGMLHALDADHIMALSTLAARRPGWRRTVGFCSAWAIGHGLTLLGVGLIVLVAGWQLPERLYTSAEAAIGVVLAALGLWVWRDLCTRRLRLRAHRHGSITHVHLVSGGDHERRAARLADHSPTFVGIAHGLAGAAPLMALVPTIHQGHVGVGLAYLALFSAGVLVNMVFFGLAFGGLQDWIARRGARLLDGFRAAIGGFAVVLGVIWVAGAV